MTGKGTPLKMLILSDLHFCKKVAEGNNKEEHSWLVHNSPSGLVIWNQMIGAIDEQGISPDLILCPGDITTMSCGESLEVAWSKLNDLRSKFPSAVLAVATGNHDVESRRPVEGLDAMLEMEQYADLTQNLKLLDPPYPITPNQDNVSFCPRSTRVHYFGADFAIYNDDPRYRLVVFNSCSRHRDDSKEYNRGSVSQAALKWLEYELREAYQKDKTKCNIFMCHHHPIKHDDYDGYQYDEMFDGGKLITVLQKYGHWLIVHGHKHHARLVYSHGGTKKTPIFSAGTFSAHKATIGPETRNQFYVMQLEESNGRPLKGILDVWNWSQHDGWQPGTNMNQKVFKGVGFGFSGELEDLADEIDEQLNMFEEKTWEELSSNISGLKYLVPNDYEHLDGILSDKKIEFERDSHGSLVKLKKVG